MNKVMLVGRLTRDPEVRYSQSADPVAIARFGIAVNKRFKKEGEPDADFLNCVAFGKTGEFVERHFKKGMSVGICGRINVSSYEDAQGQRRWSTDIVAEEVEFTESRTAFENRAGQPSQAHYDSMAERYAPPSDFGAGSSAPAAASPAPSSAPAAPAPAAVEGFAAITESIDDDDLPF
jgi:single-strand DNA-binding protein